MSGLGKGIEFINLEKQLIELSKAEGQNLCHRTKSLFDLASQKLTGKQYAIKWL